MLFMFSSSPDTKIIQRKISCWYQLKAPGWDEFVVTLYNIVCYIKIINGYCTYLVWAIGKPTACISEIKTQISFAVMAKLISAFVFATKLVQSFYMYFLNSRFQASKHPLWLCSPVCVRPERKPQRWFSHDAARI